VQLSGTVANERLSTSVSLLGQSIDSAEITDGTIVNADVSDSAAIADTKLATIVTPGKVADSALSVSVSLLGQSIESAEIANGTIVPADVNTASFSNTFWRIGGNAGANPTNGAFLGTTDNQPLEIKVNGRRALRIEASTNAIFGDIPNIVGGHSGNIVSNGFVGAVIGGGGQPGTPNRAGNDFATVVGGTANTASGSGSTAMGNETTASGQVSTAMGLETTASGYLSTAMGRGAKANHSGSFVWADSQSGDFASTADNQFLIRAAGGVGIGTTSPQAPLHVLGNNSQLRLHDSVRGNYWNIYTEALASSATSGNLLFLPGPGGVFGYIRKSDGNYYSGSDARLKKDVRGLGGVLDRVLQLQPVSYRFKSAPASAPPAIGLIAQEVEPLFPEVVAEHDGMKSVTYSGLVPVALGAIQELNQKLTKELKRRDAENVELRQRLEKLEILLNQKLHGGVK
jgi:hypothetical protein